MLSAGMMVTQVLSFHNDKHDNFTFTDGIVKYFNRKLQVKYKYDFIVKPVHYYFDLESSIEFHRSLLLMTSRIASPK